VLTNKVATTGTASETTVLDIIGYPNPFIVSKAVNNQFKIAKTSTDAVIQIFSSNGELVRTINEIDFGNNGWVGWMVRT